MIPVTSKYRKGDKRADGSLWFRIALTVLWCHTVAMFPSTYFYVYFGLSHKKNAGWKCQEKLHKLRWKHIYQIHFSMSKLSIEKVSYRKCDFALWDGITGLTSGPISFTASICCYGHSEKSEQSLLSKYFCIIVLHNCVLKQQHSPPKVITAFIVSRLLALRCK